MNFNLTNETIIPTASPTEFPIISNITTNGEGSSQSDYGIVIALSVMGCMILSAASFGVYYGYSKYYKNLVDINDVKINLPGKAVNTNIDDATWSE